MFAQVIIDVSSSELDKVFDYEINIDGVKVGSRVVVPFGNSKTEGFVMSIKNSTNVPKDKIKGIIRVVEEIPALTPEVLELTNYMRARYHATTASILRLFLPSEMRKGKVRKKTCLVLNLKEGLIKEEAFLKIPKNADKQFKALEFLFENGKAPLSVISNKFSQSAGKGLVQKGLAFITEEHVARLPYKSLITSGIDVSLTVEQENAVKLIESSSKPSLIHGVTGSGKTEVYLTLIEKTVANGKSAIMLVPEISLTPQMLSRLRYRFNDNCAILHSGLSAGERFDEWWRLRTGEAKIAVGARSAVFAPLENVGIIIIDEEHDGSYESETAPRYVTEEIAKFRAKYNNSMLVLGSATPKIESYKKALDGEYTLAEMKERVNSKPMPEVIIADMKQEVKRGNPSAFSGILKNELQKVLDGGNQAIIFLNRRGYSQKVICRECGYVAKCENCDVSLTYHIEEDALKCHYCGSAYKMLGACPDCGSVNINYSGTGTQKVVSELKKLYPTARILRMDNDTAQNKESHLKILQDFSSKNADILVGTQMIAKGHDFPNVTLVGILDADMSLYFSDYRAGERTFQLITQVAGRSGRADLKGKVVLQTFSPSNAILRFAINYDYKGFFNREYSLRKATKFPPCSDIIRVMVESDNDELCITTLKTAYEQTKLIYEKYRDSFVYFNKMRSPVKRIKNKYRYQILARVIENRLIIQDEFYKITSKLQSKNVNCYTEINPSSMN